MGGNDTFTMYGVLMRVVDLFSGNSYKASMTNNMRLYDWKLEKAQKLRENIIDLGGSDDLMIGSVHVCPTDESDLDEFEQQLSTKNGTKMCDVHDGQQRLLTIYFMLIAIRDVINESECHLKDEKGRDMRDNIMDMIAPKLQVTRGSRLPRIKIDGKGGQLIEKLIGINSKDVESKQGDSVRPVKKQRLETAGDEDKTLEEGQQTEPPAQVKRMKTFYEDCKVRFNKMKLAELSRIVENLIYSTKMCFVHHATKKSALQCVFGQRNQQNPEPVDICRMTVCSHPSAEQSNARSQQMKESWGKMYEDFGSTEEDGRATVQDACLLLAQMQHLIGHQRLLSRSDDEEKLLDEFQSYCTTKIKQNRTGGCEDLLQMVESAARVLHNFRCQNEELFYGMNDDQKAKVRPIVRFLHKAKEVSTAKEMEVATFASLLLLKDQPAELVSHLDRLELIALWMMMSKPTSKSRKERLLAILKHTRSLVSAFTDEEEEAHEEMIDLATKERSETLNALQTGAIASDKKVAKAVLERLNYEAKARCDRSTRDVKGPVLLGKEQAHHQPMAKSSEKLYVSFVKPSNDENWKLRLADFVIMSSRLSNRQNCRCFWAQEELFPLTQLMAYCDEPDPVNANYRHIMEEVYLLWNLKEAGDTSEI